MKRIAICMRGAVSKHSLSNDPGYFYTPDSVYQDKPYINLNIVYDSIKKYIIKANPNYTFDFFLHGWNTDLEKTLVDMYHPVLHEFEDNRIYKNKILKKCPSLNYYGGTSQFLSLKKSIELKERHEAQSGFVYDKVILYRYDVLLFKAMKLDAYDTTHDVYCNKTFHAAIGGPIGGDFHFVMSSHNASTFKLLYDWFSKHNPFECHKSIPLFMAEKKIKLKEDAIWIQFHQEVVRKIHPSKLKHVPGITDFDLECASKQTHVYIKYGLYVSLFLALVLSILRGGPIKHIAYRMIVFLCVSYAVLYLLLYKLDIEYAILIIIILFLVAY
jgi:hypothetical protein